MTGIWKCDDCQYQTKDDDKARKHSGKRHNEFHKLTLVEK